jgi:hypothetical protein
VSSALASIGLRARSETRLFLVVLARKFKARYSSVIHLYVDNAQKTVYCRGLGDALKAVFTGRRHNPGCRLCRWRVLPARGNLALVRLARLRP